MQYRLLVIWDKTNATQTLVVSTHGFIKKQSKVPDGEIKKAEQLRLKHFKENELKKKMKTYTLEQVTDELVGKVGTPNRDLFEYEFQMELVGQAIKEARKERKLTQDELGKLIGIQKAQISRLGE